MGMGKWQIIKVILKLKALQISWVFDVIKTLHNFSYKDQSFYLSLISGCINVEILQFWVAIVFL